MKHSWRDLWNLQSKRGFPGIVRHIRDALGTREIAKCLKHFKSNMK